MTPAMTDVPHDNPVEVRAHRESFNSFAKLALFGGMHVALVLICLALGFPGHAPVFAVMLGIGGTLALIVAFLITD